MEMGLREREKEQTRQLIAETAWRLFADRGFDKVTVAEVARQAQVAVATVFNYFPTKEDLFYYRLEAFGARLVDAIGARPAGEPVLVAFRRHVMETGGLLAQVEAGDPQALERLHTVNRVVAALLAAETDAPANDPRPQVAANALVGVQRALLDYTRRRVLADEAPARLAADVRTLYQRAFALDLDRPPGLEPVAIPEPPVGPVSHLDAARHSLGLHAAGRVDGVAHRS